MAGDHNIFKHAHIGEKLYILESARNAPGRYQVRGKPCDVFSLPGYIARSGPQHAGYHVENRSFSGAVGTYQARKLTPFKLDGEIAYRLKPSELPCHMAHLEKRSHGGV